MKSDLLQGPDPFFLSIPLHAVPRPSGTHAPYYREPKSGSERQARYDSGIGYVDDILARIHANLEFDDDTIILVVSDHGEEFGEHGGRFHGQTLYEEVIHVPCLLISPHFKPGTLF